MYAFGLPSAGKSVRILAPALLAFAACSETRVDTASQQRANDTSLVASSARQPDSRRSIMELLKLIRLGASEAETQAAFRGWTPLPPHPTKRAIGFLGEVSRRPVAVICYFAETALGTRLARAVVNLFPERPPDADAEALYTTVKQGLLRTYGAPKAEDDLSAERDDPPEFRMSRMTTWIAGDTVLTLGLALQKHGVRPSLPALALIVADKTQDPAARLTADRFER